jgi:hypothetical protein
MYVYTDNKDFGEPLEVIVGDEARDRAPKCAEVLAIGG